MKTLRYLIGFVVLIMVVACGQGGSSNGTRPLTPSELVDTLFEDGWHSFQWQCERDAQGRCYTTHECDFSLGESLVTKGEELKMVWYGRSTDGGTYRLNKDLDQIDVAFKSFAGCNCTGTIVIPDNEDDVAILDQTCDCPIQGTTCHDTFKQVEYFK